MSNDAGGRREGHVLLKHRTLSWIGQASGCAIPSRPAVMHNLYIRIADESCCMRGGREETDSYGNLFHAKFEL